MAYATKSDISDRYGEDMLIESFDPDNTGSEDDDLISQCLDDASSEVDSFIGALYDIPLTTVPDVIVRRTVDIAVYMGSLRTDRMTTGKKERYDEAMSWLRLVSKGTIQFGLDTETETKGGGVHLVNDAERLFTRDTTDGL